MELNKNELEYLHDVLVEKLDEHDELCEIEEFRMCSKLIHRLENQLKNSI